MRFYKGLATMAAVILAVMTTTAHATPVYNGPKSAPWGVAGLPDLTHADTTSGYYLWTNPGTHTWSLRWTSIDNDPSPGAPCENPGVTGNGSCDNANWMGSILVSTGLGNVAEVKFENSTDVSFSASIPGLGQFVSYSAFTNVHWDGIDFDIDPDSGLQVVAFQLGSTLFNRMAQDNPDQWLNRNEGPGYNIFIGEGLVTPSTLIQRDGYGNVVQRFEVQVPEPGTLGLLGAGLLALGLVRRNRTGI